MFGYKNSMRKSLILASVLALTGGIALAEQDQPAASDGDRPARQRDHKADHDGKRYQGEHGDHGQRGKRGEKGERSGRDHRKAMHKRLFGGLELTDDQKAQIKEIMTKHGDERKAWHEAHKDEFHALRQKMREAREADDKDGIQGVRDEIKALIESAPKPDAAHDEIRAVLNEEQQATFDERVAKMRERMEQWKEQRGDGPPGPPHGWHGRGPDGEKGPGHHGPGAEGRRRHAGRIFGNLELDDEQKASIRETMQGEGTREEKMAAVRELLTEDQQAQLDKNIQKMREWREKRKAEQDEHRKRRKHRDGDGEGRKRDRSQDDDGDDKLDL